MSDTIFQDMLKEFKKPKTSISLESKTLSDMIIYGADLEKQIQQLEAQLVEHGWISVEKEGQVKKGDYIHIIGKNPIDSQVIRVAEILDVDGHEEILLNKRKNTYFITNMLINGESWVKSAKIWTPPQEQ